MTNTVYFHNTIRDFASTTTEETSSTADSYTNQQALNPQDDNNDAKDVAQTPIQKYSRNNSKVLTRLYQIQKYSNSKVFSFNELEINFHNTTTEDEETPSTSNCYTHHQQGLSTYYTNQTSFRIEGVDGEIDRICQTLGLPGPDDFAISIAAWEARKIRYLHPRSGFHNFDTTSDKLQAQAQAATVSYNEPHPEPELVRESGATITTTSGDKRGIKGIRPPLLTRPPSIDLNDDDDDSSSTATDPMYITSPEAKLKKNIKSWEKCGLLGSGSFGTVYEGFSDDGFFFAVKEVSLLEAKQSIYQLEQEISLLSQFEHENIVQYLGTDKDKEKIYIFLELVTKGSLAQLYQRYRLLDSIVSAYTRQILHGLKYLHDRKVVHRDVKCANILVNANGSVKLADFGLAKGTKWNDVKSCKGTAFWMAPEVVRSCGYELAADIWSLGCTVLEMLTRRLPYYPLECMQALFRIGRGERPPVPNSLSRDARDFIHQCLQVKPDDRPTAAQLLEHPFVKRPLSASSASPSPSPSPLETPLM